MNNSEHDAQKETPVLVSRLHRMASLSKNLNTTSIKFNTPFDNSKDVELMQEAAVEIERLYNKVQDLQAHAEQDSCIVDKLRWQLMHSIYCPRQSCHICSEIEKEICHG